jgi:putative ABC transport system substrate-binding protein
MALWVPPAGAQRSAYVPRIGYLNYNFKQALVGDPTLRRLSEPFIQGLNELGYVEGQNITLQTHIGDETQFYNLAAELVQRKPDVIVVQNIEPTRAAMAATKTIPIVMSIPADPVLLGFVASLERPGGNVTGVSGLTTELGGKWLELVKETIPTAKRIVVLWNKNAEETFPTWKSLDLAARSLRIDIDWVEVRGASDIPRRFGSALSRKPDAFIVLPGFSMGRNMKEIAEIAQKNRLPGMYWRTDLALETMGGLIAYGANRLEQSRRAAYFVDKILKGAKPADLPVELPKSFELVINLKAAREIGITIPPRVLAWADRVIK